MPIRFLQFMLLALVFISSSSFLDPPVFPDGVASNPLLPAQPVILFRAREYKIGMLLGGEMTVIESGAYDVTGTQITFIPAQFSTIWQTACGDPRPYSYTWSYNQTEQTLSFSNIDDACLPRSLLQEFSSWAFALAPLPKRLRG